MFNLKRSDRIRDRFIRSLTQICLGFCLLALLAIVVFILGRGLPHINLQLLFGDYGRYPSLKPAFAGTMNLVLLSLGIAAPIGIGSALYLSEFARRKTPMLGILRLATETLAGIPSIVYGIFGYLVFVVALRLRYTLLGGGITLAIMILPVIIRSTEESLIAVPDALREGSLALGASKRRCIFSVVLPAAKSGIMTSLVLSIGRVLSESAVLILTIGMVVNKMPKTLLSPGTSLALDIYYFSTQGYPEAAAASGGVLLVLVAAINLLAMFLSKSWDRE